MKISSHAILLCNTVELQEHEGMKAFSIITWLMQVPLEGRLMGRLHCEFLYCPSLNLPVGKLYSEQNVQRLGTG